MVKRKMQSSDYLRIIGSAMLMGIHVFSLIFSAVLNSIPFLNKYMV